MANENGRPIKVGMDIDVKDTEKSVNSVAKSLASAWKDVSKAAKDAMDKVYDAQVLSNYLDAAQMLVKELTEANTPLEKRAQLEKLLLELSEQEFKLEEQKKASRSAQSAMIRAEAQGKNSDKQAKAYDNTLTAIATTEQTISSLQAKIGEIRGEVAEALTFESAVSQSSELAEEFDKISHTIQLIETYGDGFKKIWEQEDEAVKAQAAEADHAKDKFGELYGKVDEAADRVLRFENGVSQAVTAFYSLDKSATNADFMKLLNDLQPFHAQLVTNKEALTQLRAELDVLSNSGIKVPQEDFERINNLLDATESKLSAVETQLSVAPNVHLIDDDGKASLENLQAIEQNLDSVLDAIIESGKALDRSVFSEATLVRIFELLSSVREQIDAVKEEARWEGAPQMQNAEQETQNLTQYLLQLQMQYENVKDTMRAVLEGDTTVTVEQWENLNKTAQDYERTIAEVEKKVTTFQPPEVELDLNEEEFQQEIAQLEAELADTERLKFRMDFNREQGVGEYANVSDEEYQAVVDRIDEINTELAIYENGVQQVDSSTQQLASDSENLHIEGDVQINTDTAEMSVGELMDELDQLNDLKNAVASGEADMSLEEWNALNDRIKEINTALKGTQKAEEQTTSKFQKFKTVASTVGSAVVKGFQQMSKSAMSLGKTLSSKIKNGFNKVKSAADKAFSGKSLKKGLTTLLKYTIGVRSIYFAFRKLRAAIKEGIDNVVRYNATTNDANKKMTEFKTSLQYAKNAWGAAFAPLISIVMPYLTKFIDTIAEAGNAVARFFAYFNQQDTVVQAVRKGVGDYADSLDKSSKSAKKAEKANKNLLGSYDKLQVITKENDDNGTDGGGSGNGAEDVNSMFTTIKTPVTDFVKALKDAFDTGDLTDVGKLIGDKLKAGLDSIPWKEIQEKFAKAGKMIGTFLKGLFSTEGLMESIGKSVGEIVNTFSIFVDNLLTATKDVDFGKGFAELINGFFEATDWDLIAKNIKEFFSQFKKNIKSFLDNIKWDEIRKSLGKIATALGEALKDIANDKEFWKTVGKTISEIVNTITSMIGDFLKGTEGSDWGGSLATMLNQIFSKDGIDFKGIGKNITSALTQVMENFKSFFDTVDTDAIGESVKSLLTSIDWGKLLVDAIKLAISAAGFLIKLAIAVGDAVSDALMEINPDDIVNAIKDVVESVKGADIAGTLGKIVQSIIKSLFATGAVIGALVSAIGTLIGEAFWELQGKMEEGWDILFSDLAAEGKDVNFVNVAGKLIEGLGKGIADAFGNAANWVADNIIAPIVDNFKKLMGIHSPSTVFAGFGEDLVDGLKNGISGIWEAIKGFFVGENGIVTKITKNMNFDALKTSISTAWDTIKGVFTGLWDKIKSWFSGDNSIIARIKANFNFDTLKTNVSNAWTNIKNVFTGLWDKIKSWFSGDTSIVSKIKKNFSFDSLKTTVEKVWNTIKGFFTGTWDKIKSAFTGKDSIVEKIKKNFSLDSLKTAVSNAWGKVTGIFTGAWDKLKNTFDANNKNSLIYKLKTAVLGVAGKVNGKDTLVGGIVGNILSAFENLKTKIKSPLNAVIGFFEGFVNKIIDGINFLVGKINGLKIEIPKIGGGSTTYGFNFPTLKYVSIPRLAQGAVIPPNKEFMALLGDQKQGTNIEAPLNTMVEAFERALDSRGSTNHEPIVLQLDGRVIAKTVWDEEAKKYKQTGFGLSY